MLLNDKVCERQFATKTLEYGNDLGIHETYSSVGKLLQNILLTITTNIFTFDVSVSIRDLHQKKYDQFFFRFLPQ